jgi:toxin ParE1/3/4
MVLKIIWSAIAETQLDQIYEYYENKVSSSVATKLVKKIIKASEKLIKSPFIGQEEELLTERKIQYRYLIFKNYKLIYSIDLENGFVKIADVFDTRQNPQKIKRVK